MKNNKAFNYISRYIRLKTKVENPDVNLSNSNLFISKNYLKK